MTGNSILNKENYPKFDLTFLMLYKPELASKSNLQRKNPLNLKIIKLTTFRNGTIAY